MSFFDGIEQSTVGGGSTRVAINSVNKMSLTTCELFTTPSGTEGIRIIFSDDSGKTLNDAWWLSDKALQITKQRILDLGLANGFTKEKLSKAFSGVQNNNQLVKVLNQLNKPILVLNQGLITTGKDGKDYTNPSIPLGLWCCGLEDTETTEKLEEIASKLETKDERSPQSKNGNVLSSDVNDQDDSEDSLFF